MITSQQLIERIQKNVGAPWQTQQSDGFSDGVLFGNPDATVTGIATTWTPTLEVLRQAARSGKNVIICRQAPSYSWGERASVAWRNAPAPSKDMLDKDALWQAKQEFISKNNVVIIRLSDNGDARKTDGQLRGVARALGWEKFYLAQPTKNAYDPRNVYFRLPAALLSNLTEGIKKRLNSNRDRGAGQVPAIRGPILESA